MSELKPTYGNYFLQAFDYKAPGEKENQNILYIHSTSPQQSKKVLARLLDLYPKSNFFLLKNDHADYSDLNISNNLEFVNYTTQTLPSDYHTTKPGRQLLANEINQVFFCLNLDARPETDPLSNSFTGRYDNIFNFLINSGLYDRSYAVDNQCSVYSAQQLEHLWRGECFSLTWEICGHKIPLPWTQISLGEKETLFQLAQTGDGEGAIINIGNFMGGSSIILAKASKLCNREKVYSFDLNSYAFSQEMYKLNDVEDWINFEKKHSLVAAGEWKYKHKHPVRLLFIDGDHSYEGCKNDILAWAPYLIPGGIIAIHDYGNVSQGEKYASVVNAVYDTILTDNSFTDFKRIDTLFLATKQNP